MNKNLIINMFVSAMVSAIVTTVIVISLVSNFSNNGVSGKGGYFSISGNSATLTGYDWLQLNNKSDNKIQLANGKVFVTSPSFEWNGETVATREWVEKFCK